jgi:hypothetical protein
MGKIVVIGSWSVKVDETGIANCENSDEEGDSAISTCTSKSEEERKREKGECK